MTCLLTQCMTWTTGLIYGLSAAHGLPLRLSWREPKARALLAVIKGADTAQSAASVLLAELYRDAGGRHLPSVYFNAFDCSIRLNLLRDYARAHVTDLGRLDLEWDGHTSEEIMARDIASRLLHQQQASTTAQRNLAHEMLLTG